MTTRTFDVRATVAASPEAAIDFLLRLDRHRGLHAYVQRAEVVAEGAHADGHWWEWKVAERPRVGPFAYTLRFRARMVRTSAVSMTGRVRPAPLCALDTTAVAAPVDGGALVTETVTVTAPRLLAGYMERQARIAHERMFRLLPGEFASRPDAATLPTAAGCPPAGVA
ncbi:hypothetical protein [Microbacterium sulfonylureivorans]|uniref:hypothetical protein n=1 Tax=Microbacterium sulfonylureivorans TaxID=2486854 RepID=UPI00197B6823|nr:hypothetical protein [Microbacterium sulfonylureivorans]